MVKERRDVTIESKESRRMGYSGTYVQVASTNPYDEFREKQAKSAKNTQTVNCAGTCDYMESSSNAYMGTSRVSGLGYTSDSYKNYEQRDLKGSSMQTSASTAAVARKKITKSGKLFVALYVLIVAVVAFIILSANSMAKVTSAEADSDVSQDVTVIESMDLDSETIESTNWFDELLDDLGE